MTTWVDKHGHLCYNASMSTTTDWQTHRKNRNLAMLAEAGGNIERAVSILMYENEHFDGETIIAIGAEVRLREDCGFPTADAKRRLHEAQDAEDRWMAEYDRKNPRAGR